jgi:hypothetical protein
MEQRTETETERNLGPKTEQSSGLETEQSSEPERAGRLATHLARRLEWR